METNTVKGMGGWLLAVMLFAVWLPLYAAQTNLIYGYVGNYGLRAQSNVVVTTTLQYPNPRIDSTTGFWVRQDPMTYTTSGDGAFYFTNLLWGKYGLELSGLRGTKFTFWVGTNTTGTVSMAVLYTNAAALPPDPATNYYTQGQVDALLEGVITNVVGVAASDSISTVTNGLAVTPSLSSSSTNFFLTSATNAAAAATNGLATIAHTGDAADLTGTIDDARMPDTISSDITGNAATATYATSALATNVIGVVQGGGIVNETNGTAVTVNVDTNVVNALAAVEAAKTTNGIPESIAAKAGTNAPTIYSPVFVGQWNAAGATNLIETNVTKLGLTIYRSEANVLYVRTRAGQTNDFLQSFSFSGPYNPVINFNYLWTIPTTATNPVTTGTLLGNIIDDVCPIHINGTYIGGNHGAFIAQNVVNEGHDKTAEDCGSLWTDGTAVWELVSIYDADHLWFVGTNAGSFWASFPTSIGSTLTHVTAATHTNAIAVASSVQTQLRPAMRSLYQRATADGRGIDTNVVISASRLVLEESYELLDPVDWLSRLQAAAGTNAPPEFSSADSIATLTVRYEVQPSGAVLVEQRVMPSQDLKVTYMGGIQMNDWETPAGGTNLLLTPDGPWGLPPPATSNLLNSGRLWVQVATNSTGFVSGFAGGYVTEPSSNEMSYGFVFTSGKIYPAYRTGGYQTNGHPADVIAFRVPLVCTSSNAVGFFDVSGVSNCIVVLNAARTTVAAGTMGGHAELSSGSWAQLDSTNLVGGLSVSGDPLDVARVVLYPPTKLTAMNSLGFTNLVLGYFRTTPNFSQTPFIVGSSVSSTNGPRMRLLYYSPTLPTSFYVDAWHEGNGGAKWNTDRGPYSWLVTNAVRMSLSQTGLLSVSGGLASSLNGSSNLPPTGIAGWPANSPGWLYNDGAGNYTYSTPGGSFDTNANYTITGDWIHTGTTTFSNAVFDVLSVGVVTNAAGQSNVWLDASGNVTNNVTGSVSYSGLATNAINATNIYGAGLTTMTNIANGQISNVVQSVGLTGNALDLNGTTFWNLSFFSENYAGLKLNSLTGVQRDALENEAAGELFLNTSSNVLQYATGSEAWKTVMTYEDYTPPSTPGIEAVLLAGSNAGGQQITNVGYLHTAEGLQSDGDIWSVGGVFDGNGLGLSNVTAGAVSLSVSNAWRSDATNAAITVVTGSTNAFLGAAQVTNAAITEIAEFSAGLAVIAATGDAIDLIGGPLPAGITVYSSNLSGTLPDEVFPAVLPAANGSNLTGIVASSTNVPTLIDHDIIVEGNLTVGTNSAGGHLQIRNGEYVATIVNLANVITTDVTIQSTNAVGFIGEASNLTDLNGSEITSGTVSQERLPTIPWPKLDNSQLITSVITNSVGALVPWYTNAGVVYCLPVITNSAAALWP